MAVTGAPELLIVMGASATHEQVDEAGNMADWGDPVTDEEYAAAP